MENEVKEIMEGEVVNDLGKVSRKPSKGAIIGIVAAVGLLLVFRKKINARLEKRMVNKLTKKGYTVYNPELDFDNLEPVE